MGHQRIGALPRTAWWTEVVALLANGAEVDRIAAETFKASDRRLRQAGKDPGLHSIFFLLAQMPAAARAQDPVSALRKIGLQVGAQPSPGDICAAMLSEADRRIATAGGRSDVAELASLSACEALYGALAARTSDLFDGRSSLQALRQLRTVKNFGDLTKSFLSRFLRRSLDYYLGRELPQHVGAEHRFRTVADHHRFDGAVARHCDEVAEIARTYAGEWYSKALHEGKMNRAEAGGAIAYGMTKIGSELKLR